jgi:hypothetical protein
VYYNERDPAACEWLRELMDKGLIPKGAIDERSIAAVQPGRPVLIKAKPERLKESKTKSKSKPEGFGVWAWHQTKDKPNPPHSGE